MTYEERKAEAMSMTLEELIFNYHWAMDTAYNRKNTIDGLSARCKELESSPDAKTESLHERCNALLAEKNGAEKEAEGCQWRLRKMELELEDVTHDRDELLHDLHEYEASSDRMQEELYIAQNDREKFAKALREIKVNGA